MASRSCCVANTNWFFLICTTQVAYIRGETLTRDSGGGGAARRTVVASAAVGSAQPHASLVDLTFVKARTPSHSTRRYTEPPLDFEHRTPFAALRRVLRTRTNPASYSIYYSSTYGTYVALYVCRYVLRTSAPYVVCMYYYCASSCPVNFKIILAQAMH